MIQSVHISPQQLLSCLSVCTYVCPLFALQVQLQSDIIAPFWKQLQAAQQAAGGSQHGLLQALQVRTLLSTNCWQRQLIWLAVTAISTHSCSRQLFSASLHHPKSCWLLYANCCAANTNIRLLLPLLC